MDCSDFAGHWQALVAGTLDETTKAALAEHARSCHHCGKQWDAHHEVCTTIQSVLEDHRLTPNLAEETSDKVYQEHFGAALGAAAVPSNTLSGVAWKTSGIPLFVAALAGGLVGYFLAGPRSQSALMQQIAFSEMLGGRSPRGGMAELMLLEQMGGSSVAGAGLMSQGLPQITNTVRIVFFVVLLLWITRTRAWNTLFPTGVPVGIRVARWAALLAAILGLGRCAAGIAVTLELAASMGGGGRQAAQSLAQWLPYFGILDQLWSTAFWLTLILVLFSAANQLTLRLVHPSQRAAG